MTSQAFTDLILALLHEVAGPCHRHRGLCGGWHHRRMVITPTSSPLSPSLVMPHRHVVEWPLSPSPDRSAYRLMETQTLTPLHGVAEAGRVPSMVGGLAPTRLHRSMVLRHWAVRGRRRGRRRRRRAPHLDGHRPCWGADDTLDGAHLHWSMGLTPWSISTKDRHHATNLADPFPHRVGTVASTPF
jgi:hypothetical protein